MHVKYKRAEVIRSRCTPAHGSDFLFCKTEQTTQTHDTLICQMLILQSLRQFSWQSQAPRYRHNETQSQVQFWRLLTALELLRYILFAFQNFVAGMVSIMSTLQDRWPTNSTCSRRIDLVDEKKNMSQRCLDPMRLFRRPLG